MPERDPDFYDAGSGLPSSPGPLPTGPLPGAEPEPDTQAATEAPSDPPAEFDPRVRDPFTGLLYLGELKDSFDWLGHRFQIRTLRSGDLLEIALVVAKYADTIGASRAYADATAAACLISVDGKELPVAITTEPTDTDFIARFEYVSKTYYPPVIDVIYDRYLQLEGKVEEAIAAMGKAPG